jgi:hypothetical protein
VESYERHVGIRGAEPDREMLQSVSESRKREYVGSYRATVGQQKWNVYDIADRRRDAMLDRRRRKWLIHYKG